MKKLTLAVATLLFFSMLLSAQHLKLEVKGSYLYPSESAFRDIYGKGWKYGGEVGLGTNLNNLHGIEIWVGATSFNKKGQLTYTKEPTELKVLSIGAGVKYKLNILRNFLFPYVGLGFNYNQFKETNLFGEISQDEYGYQGLIGVYLKPFKGILLDLYVDYSSCKMKPEDIEFDIGGFSLGLGFGYEF
jgi:opacity protein-like surface antigen